MPSGIKRAFDFIFPSREIMNFNRNGRTGLDKISAIWAIRMLINDKNYHGSWFGEDYVDSSCIYCRKYIELYVKILSNNSNLFEDFENEIFIVDILPNIIITCENGNSHRSSYRRKIEAVNLSYKFGDDLRPLQAKKFCICKNSAMDDLDSFLNHYASYSHLVFDYCELVAFMKDANTEEDVDKYLIDMRDFYLKHLKMPSIAEVKNSFYKKEWELKNVHSS